MDSTTVGLIATDVQVLADSILEAAGSLVPGAAVPAKTAEEIIDLFAALAQKAIAGWGAASNTPITAETIVALLPNATPLTLPTS